MENRTELYFTTGEFARILGVKKHTLFHYDQIGLLSPALKEENGYRYYFVWQMDVFEVIKALQKLGMPLEEIKEYIENRSPERFMKKMDEKEKQIDREIEHLKQMKRFIRNEKNNITAALNVPLGVPMLVGHREEFLLVSDITASDERRTAVEIAEHVREQEKYHGAMGAVGSICLKEDLEKGLFDKYVKVYTKLEKRAASPKVMKRPAGEYVEMYYRGYAWDMEAPYERITGFSREIGRVTGEMWYEDLLLDELTVKGYEDYVVRVMVPVYMEGKDGDRA